MAFLVQGDVLELVPHHVDLDVLELAKADVVDVELPVALHAVGTVIKYIVSTNYYYA